jgi:hypothetical protein
LPVRLAMIWQAHRQKSPVPNLSQDSAAQH